MNYEEFQAQSSFSQEEVLGLAHGSLFDDAPPEFKMSLPLPPMLMVDRIVEVSSKRARGRIVAERDVRVDDWFFQCHFLGDPVQPGCLGVDAVWQLLGFYCAWRGALGSGRALGCGEIEFAGQIRPFNSIVRYEVDIVRYQTLTTSGSAVVLGDASVYVDDDPIYEIKRAKVGMFRDIDYPDYPLRSRNSRGGKMGNS